MIRLAFVIFISCALVFSIGNFGAVRSPDGEIQFRTAESLAFRNTFAIESDLKGWPGFGVARGLDGRSYSVFGPLQPWILSKCILLLEPLTRSVAESNWKDLPKSHYAGSFDATAHSPLDPGTEIFHARRFVMSFLQPILGAFAVTFFFVVAEFLIGSQRAALYCAAAFAFATPLWTYSATCFSEVLALCLLLLSLLSVIGSWKAVGQGRQIVFLVFAGFCFGLSCLAHISVLLWLPFLAAITPGQVGGLKDLKRWSSLQSVAAFLVGVLPGIIWLAWFNLQRFGNVFETGRSVRLDASQQFGYGYFIFPGESLGALLFSAGKGLFIFAPIVLLTLLCWKFFSRANPWAAKILLFGALFRILFIAARSDWHGGFALGPRYLLLTLPFLLLPLGYMWKELTIKESWRWILSSLLGICMVEQAYLCCGEIFLFYHERISVGASQGLNLFDADKLYLEWQYSPLFGFAGKDVGPVLLKIMQFTVLQSTLLLMVAGLLPIYLWFKVTPKQNEV